MADSRYPEAIQKPTYPQYTNLALGEGLADQLMALVNHHLDKQYKQARITGADYAQVLTGSITAVLQFSTQYLLGILLIDEQKAKLLAEVELVGIEKEKLEAELALIELQKAELRYKIEELLPLQKQQIELQNLKLQQEGLLIAAQVDKIEKEIEFLTAKILTEQANTQAGIAAGDSLIGRQMSLLAAQKLGFSGDIQIKAAKVHADYDAVFQSVQENPGDSTLAEAATGLLSSAATTAAAIAAT